MNDASQHPLDPFFAPRTVAVIGATDAPNTYGRTLLWNLISQPFGGTVLPINPRRRSVLGIRAYPSIAALGEPIDLALIVTPAPTVPEVIGECAAAGVRAGIILSAGFHEPSTDAAPLEHQILAQARASGMRLLGPGSLGLMRPHKGLNATLTQHFALPGTVGFISQSAALCSAVLDWSVQEHVGFSALISVGSMLDLGWGELIDYLGDDPHTSSIVIYLETIGEVRGLLSAAREVALTKPIIVLKAGHSRAGAPAARSDTGRIADADAALDAAFRRCGVLRATSISEMFAMADLLAKQPRPRGPHLSIVTNAGAPGVLAADALTADGGALAELSAETRAALDQALPPAWSHANPIDILGSADAARYGTACDAAVRDSASDGLLVILTPQLGVDPTRAAEETIAHTRGVGRPILASWMGGPSTAAGRAALNRAGIPTFDYPDLAARAFTRMWEYSHALHSLYETPSQPPDDNTDPARAAALVGAAQAQAHSLLTKAEAMELLAAYDIPTLTSRAATSPEQAVEQARALGYPVALKLLSTTIAQTASVGGTRLHLGSDAAVQRAYASIAEAAGPQHFAGVLVQPMLLERGYELLLGFTTDPQFGPLLLFGEGGRLFRIRQDHALALPPLTTTLARRLIEQTRIFGALRGTADLALLERILVRLSQLAVEQRQIDELDINPLLVSGGRALALDARVLLHRPGLQPPPLAIRPYPTQYTGRWALRDGSPVIIRPIRPDDEPLMVAFHQTLSEQSVYFRYFHQIGLSQRVTHERLARMCFIDYDRAIALVMLRQEPDDGPQLLAIARLMRQHGTTEAEFALLVSDLYQRHGIGLELMSRLLAIGRAEGVRRIVGFILPENTGMRRICEKLGFKTRRAEGMIEAAITLDDA